MLPEYPVYVISKGRSDVCLTARFLIEDKVPFSLVIEPQELDEYEAEFKGQDYVTIRTLPFSNLGLGSIPARNWCWEHSKSLGFAWHWLLDDNIRQILRRYKTKRLPCNSGPALRITEEFVSRYTNIGLAGLNYSMFAPDNAGFPPFRLNAHLYSCLLIQNALPQRWRGRYNEDTDLCLQVLAAGLCTVQMNVFLIQKIATMKMKGGNMTDLYQGDGRLKMARSLERMWPGVSETKRRYGRPQHVIKYAWRKFDTPLQRRTDIDWAALPPINEFGFELQQIAPEIKSNRLRALVEEFRQAQQARLQEGEPNVNTGSDQYDANAAGDQVRQDEG